MYELEQSIQDYENYIEEHRSNVSEAWYALFRSYYSANDKEAYELANVDAATLYDAVSQAEKLTANHDASKYDDEEFEAYRIHFYPTAEDSARIERGVYDDTEGFARAFHHHCQCNPHHAQYWCDENGYPAEDMPLEYIIEMICDWEAMSMKFGGSTLDWWQSKAGKERACMTSNTISLVNQMMNTLFLK